MRSQKSPKAVVTLQKWRGTMSQPKVRESCCYSADVEGDDVTAKSPRKLLLLCRSGERRCHSHKSPKAVVTLQKWRGTMSQPKVPESSCCSAEVERDDVTAKSPRKLLLLCRSGGGGCHSQKSPKAVVTLQKFRETMSQPKAPESCCYSAEVEGGRCHSQK